jgi:hypothetical protein
MAAFLTKAAILWLAGKNNISQNITSNVSFSNGGCRKISTFTECCFYSRSVGIIPRMILEISNQKQLFTECN